LKLNFLSEICLEERRKQYLKFHLFTRLFLNGNTSKRLFLLQKTQEIIFAVTNHLFSYYSGKKRAHLYWQYAPQEQLIHTYDLEVYMAIVGLTRKWLIKFLLKRSCLHSRQAVFQPQKRQRKHGAPINPVAGQLFGIATDGESRGLSTYSSRLRLCAIKFGGPAAL
jgi:hypothetical protein